MVNNFCCTTMESRVLIWNTHHTAVEPTVLNQNVHHTAMEFTELIQNVHHIVMESIHSIDPELYDSSYSIGIHGVDLSCKHRTL